MKVLNNKSSRELDLISLGQAGFHELTYSLVTGKSVSSPADRNVTVTSTSHGLTSGDYLVCDFSTVLTDGTYEIEVIDANSFKILEAYTGEAPDVEGVTVSYYRKFVCGTGHLTAVTRFAALMVDAATTTFSATKTTNAGGGNLTSATRIEGRVIYGDFTSVTVTAGTVLGYIG